MSDNPSLRRSSGDAPVPAAKFRCPICRAMQAIYCAPERGRYLLCNGYLGVLLIDEAQTAVGTVTGVRPLAPEDLDHIPSDVHLAILEEKTTRLRERKEAGQKAMLREPIDAARTPLEPFQEDDPS